MKRLSFALTLIFISSVSNAQSSTEIPDQHVTSVGVSIELPFLSNGISYDYSDNKEHSQTGYLGGGICLFYRKNKNKFFVNYEHPSLKKNLFPPKGGSADFNTNIAEFTIHHTLHRSFALIGGINYATYRFHSYNDVQPIREIDKSDATVGLTTGAEYLPAQATAIGFTYRPSLISFGSKSYRHILSLFFRYDINFWKK